jgi:hypothetical protein
MLISHYLWAGSLASFHRAASRPMEAFSGSIERPQQQPSKPNLDGSVDCGIEPHRPTSKTATDGDLGSVPIDLSMLIDSSPMHPGISNVLRCARINSRRALVDVRRTLHAESFVGPFTVKLFPPQIQGCLLSGMRLQLLANVPVHSFMPAIVLRMPRPPSLQIYPQGQPPDRKPTQPKECLRVRKGRTIVAANGSWQPITLKQPFKTQTHCLGPAVGQSPQLQKITAVFVSHRQRFAALTRWIIPPTFKVHCPHLVGCLASSLRPQPPRLHRRSPSFAWLGHPSSRQHPLETTFRCRHPMHPQIQRSNLARPPIWVQPLEPHHLANHLRTQLLGMAPRSARLFGQTLHTKTQQPIAPFVAGLGTNAILGTQRPEVIRPQRFQRKLHPLIHRSILFPRHPRAYRSQKPLLKCYLCSEPTRHPCSEPAPNHKTTFPTAQNSSCYQCVL